MTRIIGGVAGGRRLVVPAGRGTRPTSDRVREALFSSLESLRGPLAGARVLDLFAGSGAIGLEAGSRGAADVLLVESDRTAAAALRANIAALGLPARLVLAPVERVLAEPPPGRFDVVVLDPPYATSEAALAAVLSALVDERWLDPGAVVVVERSTRAGEPGWPAGMTLVRSRRYGDTTLWYGRAAGT